MARLHDPNCNPADDLVISEEFPNCVAVDLLPSLSKWQMSSGPDKTDADRTKAKRQILLVNGQDNFVEISPINTLAGHERFFERKYERLVSLVLDGFDFDTPKSPVEVVSLLEEFPAGFIKDYEYGLGLVKDYQSIIFAVEEIPDVESLVISKTEPTGLHDYGLVISFDEFEELRKAINRITENYRSEARQDRDILVHNKILTKLDPEKFPARKRGLKKGVIHKFVSSTSFAERPSRRDSEAIVELVINNQKAIHSVSRKRVIELQQDIELMNLEWLISEVDKLLARKSSEGDWQGLLSDNPYLLSLVFGYPILKIQDQASVGGRTITGSGDKITDFLVKNRLTQNSALVEIKKPSTKILRSAEYRAGLYSPSHEFAGSIGQLLDQKYKFQREIASIKENAGLYDIETFMVDCVLIIGTTPESRVERKSFELIRHNSRDVSIFTFDELAAKLKDIHSLLSPSEEGR
ncbi:Shedu immune nuclease family protein [Rhodopirellula sp. P2]|uniref:Shedu immune nuclease family protein n=1 Tax=Rhodopirellula sp. P2 TaxID=2127060 RepID=UPI0023685AFB|nr:Shedu immune nuclease family protein [Rhodopirellula sp. P2]WDQ16445.1 DUF4263 domain-containing protein [Rhodopirellula sp. P2]